MTVTLIDGLVLARSAFNHSVNYRSVVAQGRAELVRDEQDKAAVLAALVESVVPGRSSGSRPADRRELAATALLRLPLREVSLKTRSGPPSDDPEDLDLPHWTGVLPLSVRRGEPVAAPGLAEAPVPEHVRAWAAQD